MQSVDFTELVKWFGLPGAMLAVMVVALARGTFISKREADALDQAHKDQKAEYEERLRRIREERDFWRQAAMENMAVANKATDTVVKAVQKLPSPLSPPPGGD
jgi:hypothetical protein